MKLGDIVYVMDGEKVVDGQVVEVFDDDVDITVGHRTLQAMNHECFNSKEECFENMLSILRDDLDTLTVALALTQAEYNTVLANYKAEFGASITNPKLED